MAERLRADQRDPADRHPGRRKRSPLRRRRRRHPAAKRDRHRLSRRHRRAQSRRLSALARRPCSIARSAGGSISAAPRARPARCIEEEAVIRTGADGARRAADRGGLRGAALHRAFPRPIVYPSVPEGLSPRPTLSVRARSSQAATATVTLSYLATGFDWQANYVAKLSRDGHRVDLFAWLTLASIDETSFPTPTPRRSPAVSTAKSRSSSRARAARCSCAAGRRRRPATCLPAPPPQAPISAHERPWRRFAGGADADRNVHCRHRHRGSWRARRIWAISSSTASPNRSPSPPTARSRWPC